MIFWPRVSFLNIAAYPRKGTITKVIFLFPSYYSHCSLSPQGDDNKQVVHRVSVHKIAAYPRKGTITAREQKLRIKKDAEFFFYKT